MIRRKKLSLDKIEANKTAINKRNKLFKEVWASRPHKCENCGVKLFELRTYMMDHLLEKSKFPQLEFEVDNLMIVCMDCHSKKTNGFLSPIQQMRVNQVKKQYNIL